MCLRHTETPRNTSEASSLLFLIVLHPQPHRAKARAVFTLQKAVLTLPAEAPGKALLFGFACQPDLPSALSQPADISSPVSASFVHQSSRQCCFMMCCKTTLRVLSVAASFITAQPSRRDIIHHCLLRARSQSPVRAAASAQSRVNAPQQVPLSSGCVFFLPFFSYFFPGNGTSSYILFPTKSPE